MRFLNVLIWSIFLFLIFPEPSYAAINNPEVANFTNTTLNTIIAFASLATSFFLIKGGYLYMTSSGKPDTLDDAKKTIKNAVLGLVLILGAAVFLAFIFGGIGIHKFYLGQVGWGLTYILFSWSCIPMIAGFIEGFIYLTMSKKDFEAKYS